MNVAFSPSDRAETRDRTTLLVLVVEDDGGTRHFIAEAIRAKGFNVLEASDGIEAYRLFDRERPDLVISDIYLPYTNGIVLMNKIKVHSPETKILLITGYSHYKQLLQGSRFPPNGFLTKPFSVEELYVAIGQVFVGDTPER